MKKIILLCISLLSLPLLSQNIRVTLQANSIKVKNDSLYFRYRIQNNSDTTYAFYNVGLVDVDLEVVEDDWKYIDIKTPRFAALIYDKDNKLPTGMWFTLPAFQGPNTPIVRTYEDSISSLSYKKYIVLAKGESTEYAERMYIGNIYLKKGTYKFQLEYFAGKAYRSLYARHKKKGGRIKDSVMFEGRIKSNFCSFTYPRYP